MTFPVSVNGTVIPPDAPAISPHDRSLTLGDGLFETIKVEDGNPWYLERHLVRLERSAKHLGIFVPPALRQWIESLLHMPELSETTQLTLRITITRGTVHTQGLVGTNDAASTTIIALYPAPLIPASVYDAGLTAHVASAARNERGFAAGIKTTSYIESILALREARMVGADDALFLDTRGFVSEATTSNVFAMIDDILVTPALSCGPLPGITREVVLELATTLEIATEQGTFTLHDLLRAQEAFCTSSLRGIAPLVRLDGYTIGEGVPGPVTRRLAQAYLTQRMRR